MDEVTPRWFRATDVPIRDETPFRTGLITSKPLVWEAFGKFDSERMEALFKDKATPYYLPLEFDSLFEVDLNKKEFYAIYWQAATFEIRRGIWFEPAAKSSGYSPCDENLTKQIEDGYRKFLQIKETMDEKAFLDWRWPLLGPYLNQFVSFTNTSVAYLQTDDVTSKIARALTRTAGVKIYRGWEHVPIKAAAKSTTRNSTAAKPDSTEDVVENSETASAPTPAEQGQTNEAPPTEPRQIEHLILAIHGIGQKLSAHLDAMSFSKDCQVFRESLFTAQQNYKNTLNAQKQPIPASLTQKCSIQVLPIHWRHKLNVSIPRAEDEDDVEDEDKDLNFSDILPEGIPGIRMLLSDVVLDVMLYMTPKYRQQILSIVSHELNRVYGIFKERNPNFKGTVSIYGHSLGSVIGYDIAARQSKADSLDETANGSNAAAGVDISEISSAVGSPKRKLSSPEVFSPVSQIEKLEFDIDHLFTVGSPIGMFLLLGGYTIRPESSPPTLKSSRPKVKYLYNIFHAYDPVAHRLEPLFSPSLSTLKPFQVPYTKGGLTQTMMGVSQASSEVLERGKRVFSGLYSSTTNMMMSLTKIAPNPEEIEMDNAGSNSERRKSTVSPIRGATDPKPTLSSEPNKIQQAAIDRLTSLNPNGRLDYVLQETILENPYLSSLGSHMSYWNDQG